MNYRHFSPSLFLHFIQRIPYRQLPVRLMAFLTVQKLLIVATLTLVLLFDVFRIYTDPTSVAPVGSIGFEIGRLLTALFLVFLLITDPPRSLLFRSLLGVSACIIFGIATYSFFTYQLGFIDSVLYVEVAIILGLEALEPKTATTFASHYTTRVRVP